MSDPKAIRQELNKLTKMPPWGRRQGDHWDQLSNFIYHTQTLADLWARIVEVARREKLEPREFGAYAVRRWYNHHTHDQILQLFYAHPTVEPEPDAKHRTIDFYLRGLPFDLKISRFPAAYPESLKYGWQHRHHLAHWLYLHQSQQGRFRTGNRLFIILHHRTAPALAWQLRRDFEALAQQVGHFLEAPTLFGLSLNPGQTGQTHRPWTGVIFYVKS
ncbi:MAG TPA: hypothetical protein PKD98_15705 [Anaerolineae bacterium]|nr:hypothetical protein [Anaerolineae bacterium]